ncbi:MAG: hypothetical protein HeimC3_49610 [Candidatus Heimdallarchaeota archaeon LC_3]|nr:MAG: hypothetical protein HeimC3_49610 [Candidatus Heimdallarchaeota archaeon LC_3]
MLIYPINPKNNMEYSFLLKFILLLIIKIIIRPIISVPITNGLNPFSKNASVLPIGIFQFIKGQNITNHVNDTPGKSKSKCIIFPRKNIFIDLDPSDILFLNEKYPSMLMTEIKIKLCPIHLPVEKIKAPIVLSTISGNIAPMSK